MNPILLAALTGKNSKALYRATDILLALRGPDLLTWDESHNYYSDSYKARFTLPIRCWAEIGFRGGRYRDETLATKLKDLSKIRLDGIDPRNEHYLWHVNSALQAIIALDPDAALRVYQFPDKE